MRTPFAKAIGAAISITPTQAVIFTAFTELSCAAAVICVAATVKMIGTGVTELKCATIASFHAIGAVFAVKTTCTTSAALHFSFTCTVRTKCSQADDARLRCVFGATFAKSRRTS
jgi:hypothetical protein